MNNTTKSIKVPIPPYKLDNPGCKYILLDSESSYHYRIEALVLYQKTLKEDLSNCEKWFPNFSLPEGHPGHLFKTSLHGHHQKESDSLDMTKSP